MHKFQLRSISDAERTTLEQMYRNAPKPRCRQRAHMVLLAEQGYALKTIATLVGVSYNSVRHYVHAFDPHGFLALYDAPRSGRTRQLTPEQLEQVGYWLEMSPRELHYQQSCWSMKLMAQRIKATYQVTLTPERVRQLVRQMGYTLVRPRHQSRLPDPKQVEQAKQDIEQFQAQAKRGEILLFYQDEARLSRFPTITRMWVRKGTQYQIPTEDDHTTFWAYAVSNPLTGKVHYRIEDPFSGEGFRRLLEQLRRHYPTAEIVLITDRASVHRKQLVQEYLEQDGRMRLYKLPSYSPELNRIERLWKWLRRRVTHVHLFESIPEMKEAVRNFFRYINRVPKKVLRCLAVA